MRRAIAILKYVPAVLCGLLVVAWVVSEWTGIRLDQWFNGEHQGVRLEDGSLHAFVIYDEPKRRWPESVCIYPLTEEKELLGHWDCDGSNNVYDGWSICLPIPGLLTALLLPAIGPFTRFRFPLWSYFAWTALVAAELAYYLR